MAWLREQLTEDSDRKFILTSHVYGGTRYKAFQMWSTKANEAYFKLLAENQDRIIVELAGHDHFASLRAHQTEVGDDALFHNIFVAPSITPWYSNNPAVTSFEISEDGLTPHKLRSTFLNLAPTIGQDKPLP